MLAINLKKLQAIARRKLGLKDLIEWSKITSSDQVVLGKEYISLRSSDEAHIISYSDASSLNEADVYHELCKAKLYELGFSAIEIAALNIMRECSKDDPKYIRDANSAVTIIVETLVNTIFFSVFPEESRNERERMSLRFESSDALTTLHTQMGFWGIGGVCYHFVASLNSNVPFPKDLVEKAIERASDGKDIMKEYEVINSLLQELPKIQVEGSEKISEHDGIQIIDVITKLFSRKTGLEC